MSRSMSELAGLLMAKNDGEKSMTNDDSSQQQSSKWQSNRTVDGSM